MPLYFQIDEKEALQLFANLPRTTKTRVLRPAVLAGAGVVRDKARANVMATSDPFSGLLTRKGTIVARAGKQLRSGAVTARAMIRPGLVNPAKKSKNGSPVRVGLYAAILEYGTKNGRRAPKSPFRSAARESQAEVLQVVRQRMTSGLDKAISEAKRK